MERSIHNKPPTLSKSRYTIGLRCHRYLWWRTYEPDAPELQRDEATRYRLDEGTRVGELARTYVPGGTLIDFPYDAKEPKLAATHAAIDSRANAIYEASFFADDVFVAVDILERLPNGWGLIEVKSSTRLKDDHYPDATIQTHVLRRAGLSVPRVEVMHLNRDCVYPDLSNLFEREDITEDVEAGLILVHREIERQLAVLKGPLPEVPIGRQCNEPYECPFKSRCWADVPEHHVTTLYHAGTGAFALMEEGYELVTEVPPQRIFHPIARRQQRALRENKLIVEPGLARSAGEPSRAGSGSSTSKRSRRRSRCGRAASPYDQVPVQFSLHVQNEDASMEHFEHLAEPRPAGGDPIDPRPGIAAAVLEACGDLPAIVVYNATFERQCLELLADAVPELASGLHAIAARLVDLWPVVQNHVYHPDFMRKSQPQVGAAGTRAGHEPRRPRRVRRPAREPAADAPDRRWRARRRSGPRADGA